MGEEAAKDHHQQQWSGGVEATLPRTPPSAAWARVAGAAFFAAHLYLPGIDVCERVADAGDVRHVASSASGMWARERLLETDHAARRLRYAVVDSNMGFGRYVATLRVVDLEEDGGGGGGGHGGGCRIVWGFECDAVRGGGERWSEAAMVARLGDSVKGMAERVQRAVAEEEEEGEGGVAA
uniref:Bet v I/Major latex protein domain-containing protein n=1 Tax=Leersia perrieri TaxID=77586 RepID=A0A0D9UXY3_9ORYZ